MLLVVAADIDFVDHFFGPDQCDAATGDDPFLERRLRRGLGVFQQRLSLFHLGLGCGADVDLRHSAGQLRQPLLQLLAVVVAVGRFDLAADLLGAAVDGLFLAGPAHDRRLFARDDHLLRPAEIRKLDRIELDAEVFEDRGPAGERS